ncbi:MAG: helix-turn-helix domain-containing protein [Armatimonadia bacterium]
MANGYILIPERIMERADLTPSQKLLLGVIGRLQGDKGSCFPSMEYLAKATGISRSQVVRLIGDLARRKEITRLRHPYQSNSYAVPWATARALRKKWAQAKSA